MKTTREKIISVSKKLSVFRAADLPDSIDPRSTLCRMVSKGELVRIERGLYALPNAEISRHHSLAEAVKRYPCGVICLISALFFHEIGTQMPYEIWIMRQDRRVVPGRNFPVRFVYCTGRTIKYGMETHLIEGTEVDIHTPARAVADCFKYRNKIGLDVAIEALREGWKAKRFTADELWAAARVCRVQKIMQPFLEMLAIE